MIVDLADMEVVAEAVAITGVVVGMYNLLFCCDNLSQLESEINILLFIFFLVVVSLIIQKQEIQQKVILIQVINLHQVHIPLVHLHELPMIIEVTIC